MILSEVQFICQLLNLKLRVRVKYFVGKEKYLKLILTEIVRKYLRFL